MSESIDVILPTHRRPHTLPHAIEAVLGQTYAAFQLHVIGDGCDDETASVVRSFHDPRVHFHRFPKATGFGYAHRNRILRQTSGSFVAYASDDDLWFPDHLERGLSELRKREMGLVAFRECPIRVPDTADPYFFAFDWKVGILRRWFAGAATYVHHRWVFDKVGYWNEDLVRFGDREFGMRVRRDGVPCAYLDEVTVLRFYARHWDDQYSSLRDPPQKRYLAKLQDPHWRQTVRQAAAGGLRPPAVRMRQWGDFLQFAMSSGPKLGRFWYHQLARPSSPGGIP